VRLNQLEILVTIWPIVLALDDDDDDDDDDRGAVGVMFGKGNLNLSTCCKPATGPLCPPQIAHDLTRDLTLVLHVGGIIKELRDLYFSASIIEMIKSRRARWAGPVA
jgi:hypothetical protein